jgi:hypothetical protein
MNMNLCVFCSIDGENWFYKIKSSFFCQEKIEFKVKCLIFVFVHMKVSWIINLRVIIMFWGKSYKLESQVFYPKNKIESILEEKSIIAENPQR